MFLSSDQIEISDISCKGNTYFLIDDEFGANFCLYHLFYPETILFVHHSDVCSPLFPPWELAVP